MDIRCLHGLEKSSCGLCNGMYEQKRHLKEIQKKEVDEYIKDKQKYEELKSKFKNHWELWTEQEYWVLYNNFRFVYNIRSREFRKTVYKVALELERTRLSIIWHYKHMFRGPYEKGGKTLVQFMELVTGG